MLGNLYFYSGTGWFSKSIKFFTRSELTHVAIGVGQLPNIPSELVFESYLTQQIDLIGEPISEFKINATDKLKGTVLHDQIIQYNKKGYGWGQLIWFMFRYLMETKFMQFFFKKDMRTRNNWIKGDKICSELAMRFILEVCLDVAPKIYQDYLDSKWKIDSLHPQDVYEFCEKYFEKVK